MNPFEFYSIKKVTKQEKTLLDPLEGGRKEEL
jgi:hypothetical protein